MAGGPYASEAPCLECLSDGTVTKVIRVSEGAETDHYRCEKGHLFGMTFPKGPATEPMWPPPPELDEFAQQA